jgi:hypothetical protein
LINEAKKSMFYYEYKWRMIFVMLQIHTLLSGTLQKIKDLAKEH